MAETISVLGISGSLRKESFNTALLRAAQGLAPDGMKIGVATLADIPLYNEDVRDKGYPEAVQALRNQIRDADAVLIATPEYNYSIPGVLKNAIDWASRSPARSALNHKPVALMGASPGIGGTMRAQAAWQQVLTHAESYLLLRPELFIPFARNHFDEDGNLVDAELRQRVRSILEALVTWARFLAAER